MAEANHTAFHGEAPYTVKPATNSHPQKRHTARWTARARRYLILQELSLCAPVETAPPGLLDDLGPGPWRVPKIRLLAEAAGVSVGTAHGALHMLVSENLIKMHRVFAGGSSKLFVQVADPERAAQIVALHSPDFARL